MNEYEFKQWRDKVAPLDDAMRIFGPTDNVIANQRELLAEAYKAGITHQQLAVATLRAQVDGYALVFKNLQIHQHAPGFLTRLFSRLF